MTEQANAIEQRANEILEEVIGVHHQGDFYLLDEDDFDSIVEYISLLKQERMNLAETLKSCEHQLFNARGA